MFQNAAYPTLKGGAIIFRLTSRDSTRVPSAATASTDCLTVRPTTR